MIRRTVLASVAAALAASALAGPALADDSPVSVCNEAENSFRGGYTVTGDLVDPAPPAFLRGSPMRVGNGAGLSNAAEHSPALRECVVPGPDDGGDDGDGGGDDGGIITS